MPAFTLTTWNVLHRVHAENWHERPVDDFPSEPARIEGITARVSQLLSSPGQVVCLQEVSGDQLASLRAALPGVGVAVHTFPRVPRLRVEGSAPLADPTEHLVVLTSSATSRLQEGLTFESDPGKGLLRVELVEGVAVVCTHVSFGDRRVAQLQTLLAHCPARCVVAGDFNAPPGLVAHALGAAFSISQVSGPTRPGKDVVIDHVLVRGGVLEHAKVLGAERLSDHHPVTAALRFD